MKILMIAALVAVASADYHDDTFHFSTLGSLSGLGGLRKSSGLSAPAAVLTNKYTTLQQSRPVLTSFQPLQPLRQVAAPAPVLLKQTISPVFAQVAQPVVYSAAPASYSGSVSAPKWRILSQIQETDPSGPYKLSYSTENGIQVSEQGALVPSAEGAVVAAQGSYSYTGPDGVVYSVSYIADENGFRAAGDHLPTPPPIPAEILKSLQENAASGEQYDDQGRLLRK